MLSSSQGMFHQPSSSCSLHVPSCSTKSISSAPNSHGTPIWLLSPESPQLFTGLWKAAEKAEWRKHEVYRPPWCSPSTGYDVSDVPGPTSSQHISGPTEPAPGWWGVALTRPWPFQLPGSTWTPADSHLVYQGLLGERAFSCTAWEVPSLTICHLLPLVTKTSLPGLWPLEWRGQVTTTGSTRTAALSVPTPRGWALGTSWANIPSGVLATWVRGGHLI